MHKLLFYCYDFTQHPKPQLNLPKLTKYYLSFTDLVNFLLNNTHTNSFIGRSLHNVPTEKALVNQNLNMTKVSKPSRRPVYIDEKVSSPVLNNKSTKKTW